MNGATQAPRRKSRLLLGVGVALALVAAALLVLPRSAPPPAPPQVPHSEAASKPSPPANPGPVFVRFETPTPKVKVHVVGEGFEIINTDPGLTGAQIDVSGVTQSGELVPYRVTLPAPNP